MTLLTPDGIDDFVNTTLKLWKRRSWTDIALEHQEYVSNTLLKQQKVTERGGEQIGFVVKTKNIETARNTGMFAEDQTLVEDITVTGSIPWTMQTTNFSYDIYEDMFQSDPETIVRELLMREHSALSDMAELQEENLWNAPTGTTDSRPYGIPFWLQKDATTTVAGGFNGTNPSGFSSGRAGISSTTYPRWRNWTFGYTNVTLDDLIKKVKKSLAFTTFMAPVPHRETGFNDSGSQIYTTYDVQEQLERLAESRNENLGADLARYINNTLVGGVPVKWVPYLQANDSTGPLYGIQWKSFKPYVKKGCDMLRHPPKEAARQHTVREVHIDHAMNYACYNLRLNWVGSTS